MTPEQIQIVAEHCAATLAEIRHEFTVRVVAFADAVVPVMARAATTITAAWDEFERAVVAEHPEVADANGKLRDDWLDILRAKKQP